VFWNCVPGAFSGHVVQHDRDLDDELLAGGTIG
jgi:hypothetical protein